MGITLSEPYPDCGVTALRITESEGPPVKTDRGGFRAQCRVQCSSCLKLFRFDTGDRSLTPVSSKVSDEKGGAV